MRPCGNESIVKPSSYDVAAIREHLDAIDEALRRIVRRFQGIQSAADFTGSDTGADKLDAIAMMLLTIGEHLKKIDKLTNGELLSRVPDMDWAGVKGTRDIIAHDYFGIDAEEIFSICKEDLAPLQAAIDHVRALATTE
ncbi:MAG: DUF86 domain-containing protein [Candidatus Hydrogenedens sp.]|nr:DUF86 domain-containing protein [Candidatus Hydrogenedens sp.]